MACCSTCEFDPCQCCDQEFTVIPDEGLTGALVQSLIPCVDSIRDIYTCLGARVYRVDLVRTRWSGGRRGRGVEELIERNPILPTPKIGDLDNLEDVVLRVGREEQGTVEISEISARFTEDQLTGKNQDGCPIPDNEQFFWEITLPTATGMNLRRRFTPASAPNLNPTAFQWTITLSKQQEDRARGGDPRD